MNKISLELFAICSISHISRNNPTVTKDFNDHNFLYNLQEALRNIQDGQPRRQARRELSSSEEFKVNELPEFAGGTDLGKYLEWERKIEHMFEFKDVDDEKACKLSKQLDAKRTREGKETIASWESLKRELRKRYVPINHHMETYRKIAKLKQGKMNVAEYIDEFENCHLWVILMKSRSRKCLGSSSGFPKTATPSKDSKETSLSKVRCYKCQGFGHFQSSCPNKRVVTLREAMEFQDELLEEEKRQISIFEEAAEHEEEEENESYEAPVYNTLLVLRALQAKVTREEADQRTQLFHTKCLVNDKWCSVVVDDGSCTNVASSEMVAKLGLVTMNHPKPYALHWLDDNKNIKVTKHVMVGLTMGSYKDDILCDVVPMDACHVILGHPWQYDRDVTHRGWRNEYELKHNNKKKSY
uniref:CCHC-type domain-containing protein n=1 Tax=Lactuca sativa TaxID=4236 RepID=A0A9R1XBQ0_LACSA|nr:hypothetical protein LSAT_V11C500244450 [Lactuca sativa]